MQYFKDDYATLDELKKDYRNLSKKYHPDLGGSEEIFKIINSSYERLLHLFVDNMKTEFNKSNETANDFDFDNFTYVNILRQILEFDIVIEIIGSWIYAKNSYNFKDKLKSLGFFFSKKHKAWIFNGGSKRKTYRSSLTVDAVKKLHGCHTVQRQARKQLA